MSRAVTTSGRLFAVSHAWRRLILALAAVGVDALLLALAVGGFPALLAHWRALALLASWGVGALFLAILRPVRGHDAVEIARDRRIVLVALFLLPLLTPPIAATGETHRWWLLPGGPPLRWAGVVLSALGVAIRIAAMARLGPRFSPLVAVQREHALETGGLYRWVRHPGYLGSLLASLGAALAFGSGLGLLPVAVFAALLASRARREDLLLERHFGEDFRAWRERTGGFLPRLGAARRDQSR